MVSTRFPFAVLAALAAIALLAPAQGREMPRSSPAAAQAPPAPMLIAEGDYRDRVGACWLGKRIGAALGAPYQGKKELLRLRYYDPLPSGPAVVAGLDIELVWLKMLRERGTDPSSQEFARYWMQHLAAYPWNEYGFCARNLERGLLPPISGWFENPCLDETGAMVRSELWACLAPGDPLCAAALARRDAQLDHGAGEGTHAEVFWAAVQSAAFVIDDPETLLRVGLERIPPACGVARAVREALWCSQNGKDWEDARNRVARAFGNDRPTYAPPVCGFAVIGWLYGQEFGDRLCKAANCGYDPARSASTLGALLGILGGSAGIPPRWRQPVGAGAALNVLTRNLTPPVRNVFLDAGGPTPAGAAAAPRQETASPASPGACTDSDLVGQTVAMARQMAAARPEGVQFGAATRLPDNAVALLFRGEADPEASPIAADSAVAREGALTLTLHYHGEPVLRPGIPKLLGISLAGSNSAGRAQISLEARAGWRISPCGEVAGETRFLVYADDVRDRERLTGVVRLDRERHTVTFAILGPGEAKGVASGESVPTCDKCGARKDACICGQAK